jgi:Apg6 BARA domain
MEADTDRLENECRLYRQAMQDEEIRVQGLKRAIRATFSSSSPPTVSSSSSSSSSDDDHEEVGTQNRKEEDSQEVDEDKDILLAEAKFQAQLEALKESCRNQQAELDHLLHLRQAQVAMAQDLDMLEWQVQDESNALELQAQAFDNEQEQLHGQLVDTLLEVDQLSSTALRFPAVLYDLRVHDNSNNSNQQHINQQQHYPTINELRLAYRPISGGDNTNNNFSSSSIQWAEIQVAWSLAAQLLLAIASLLEFQSQHWKIVPLSHCAKLIYYPPSSIAGAGISQKSHQQQQQQIHNGGPASGIVYNLGHPKSNCAQALVTWNGLLHSMVEHAMTKVARARERGLFLTSTKHTTVSTSTSVIEQSSFVTKPLPFAMSANSIGPHRTWPDANDDAGWSRVIHCMSCNLLWLSNLASTLALQEVMLATCTVPPNYK